MPGVGMPEWEMIVLEFATTAHKGQICDSGKDYMEDHILPVVNLLKQITKDRDIITAGYLHDILEDTPITYDELKSKFGICVTELVKEVTNKQVYGVKDYFPNLESKKAIIIKFADRLQNISRMEPWSKKRQQKYLDRSKFWKNREDVIESLNGQIRVMGLASLSSKESKKLFKSLKEV